MKLYQNQNNYTDSRLFHFISFLLNRLHFTEFPFIQSASDASGIVAGDGGRMRGAGTSPLFFLAYNLERRGDGESEFHAMCIKTANFMHEIGYLVGVSE